MSPDAEPQGRSRTALRVLGARLAARDPGWRRARRALRATAGAALSLAVNAAIGAAAAQSTSVALLGAVVAMVAGLSVTEEDRGAAARTFLLLPLIASASVALGAALSPWRLAADAAFVAVVFGATSLRRRGPRWSAAGFLAFMAYFFSQFLMAVPEQVPWLALSATVGVAVAALLRLVLLPERPEHTLRHLLQALEGQTAALLDSAIDVLRSPEVPPRLRQRVISASGDLNRVALMVEQQMGVGPDASAPDLDGSSPRSTDPLRDRVFLLEVAAAHVVSAVRAAVREGVDADQRAELSRDLTAVGRAVRSGRAPATLAGYAARARAVPGGGSRYRGALHVRRALAELADAAAALQRGNRDGEPLGVWNDGQDDAQDDAPGRLEQPDRVAEDEPGENRPTPRRDRHLGLQQGIQATAAVTLAIVVGEILSPTRWYWAVIAAYIVFVGADTRGATVRRAIARSVGTLVGLFAGLAVAALISGSRPAALVLLFVLLFAAWWLQPVSFLASSVCVTAVLALLYVLLGSYSGSVLLLRVEETAVGAVLGGIAALVLVPARSSPVVREAEADVLDRLTDLLTAVRSRRGSGSALRALDSAFQRLRDVARPVAKGVPGVAARRIEQRVFALSAASYSSRMLVTALLRRDVDDDLDAELDRLARRAAELADRARSGATDEPAAEVAPPDPGAVPVGADDPDADDPDDPDDPDAEAVGGTSPARTHALVALERLDLALTRWSDPLRPPAPAGTPAADPRTGERETTDGGGDHAPR